jgi:hypothetical protein
MVFGDRDVGTTAGGGCETIVVSNKRESSVVLRFVDESICVDTDKNVFLVVGAMTLMSNCPNVVDCTWTVAGSPEASSFCRVINRSYLSPPKRRDESEVQGEDGRLLCTG